MVVRENETPRNLFTEHARANVINSLFRFPDLVVPPNQNTACTPSLGCPCGLLNVERATDELEVINSRWPNPEG